MTAAISDNNSSEVEEDVAADSWDIVVLVVSSLLIGQVLIVYRIDALTLPNFTLIKAPSQFRYDWHCVAWCDQFLIGISSFTKVFVTKFIFYTGGIPQRLYTDLHSVGTEKTSAALWQRKRAQRCNSDIANSYVTALTVTGTQILMVNAYMT